MVFIAVAQVFGEAGPAIPKPKLKIEKAMELAKLQLKSDFIEVAGIKFLETIVISVEYKDSDQVIDLYTGPLRERKKIIGDKHKDSGIVTQIYNEQVREIKEIIGEEQRSWVLTYVHPIANDISYTYLVTQKGRVFLLMQTE